MTVESIGYQYSEITEFVDNFKAKEASKKFFKSFAL